MTTFGAVKVGGRNFFRLLKNGEAVLLFPGGVREVRARSACPCSLPCTMTLSVCGTVGSHPRVRARLTSWRAPDAPVREARVASATCRTCLFEGSGGMQCASQWHIQLDPSISC